MSDEAIKREHFRIDVSLPIAYRILTHEQAQMPLPQHVDGAYIYENFAQSLQQVNAQLTHFIGLITEKNKALGEMFRLLNQKIDLTRPSVFHTDIANLMTIVLANLSANGVSLRIDQHLEPDQRVDFLLLLNEEEHPLLIRAKLIRIMDVENAIAAFSFENVTPDQERRLVTYMREQELIQRKRN
jgi:c-di-GMP-binding flagellar brake protein YcgR